MGRKPRPPEERFLKKFTQLSNQECWLWEAGKDLDGYGVFQIGTKKTGKAHRFSYQHFKGKIPDGMMICHHCDTPSCVNPDHLFIGTALTNVKDCVQKGRRSKERYSYNVGNNHPRAKIIASDVLMIRKLMKSGISRKDIAARYNVSSSTISDISLKRSWKHI